jgi:hypothetical protein
MEVTRTYPPEIEAIRQSLIVTVGEIKQRYENLLNPPQQETATATAILADKAPKTPQQLAELHHGYLREIEPFVKRLAELEGFATITMKIPA